MSNLLTSLKIHLEKMEKPLLTTRARKAYFIQEDCIGILVRDEEEKEKELLTNLQNALCQKVKRAKCVSFDDALACKWLLVPGDCPEALKNHNVLSIEKPQAYIDNPELKRALWKKITEWIPS